MRANLIIFASILTATLIVGCEPPPSSTAAPSSAPSTTTASDEPQDELTALLRRSTTRSAVPASAVIDERDYDFPPVEMTLQSRNGEIVALLSTIDPPNASNPDYAGNSICLEMQLDISDSKTLNGAHWEFKATNTDREDEINGIYLNGRKRSLQPYDVHAQILGDVSPVTVQIQGMFLMFDEETDAGKPVQFSAKIVTPVKIPTERK